MCGFVHTRRSVTNVRVRVSVFHGGCGQCAVVAVKAWGCVLCGVMPMFLNSRVCVVDRNTCEHKHTQLNTETHAPHSTYTLSPTQHAIPTADTHNNTHTHTLPTTYTTTHNNLQKIIKHDMKSNSISQAPDLTHILLLLSHFAKSRPVCRGGSRPTSVCVRQDERNLQRAQLHIHRFRQCTSDIHLHLESPSRYH